MIQLDILDEPVPAPATHFTHVRAHPRRVRGPAPASGAEQRDDALARMAESKAVHAAIAYLRAALQELYRSRAATWPPDRPPFVNADDVDRLLREWPGCPREIHERASQDWRGAVFRSGWAKTGTYSRSTRKHMRATDLPGWRPVDAATTSI